MINLKKPKKFNPKQKTSLTVELQPIVGDFWFINVGGENWVVDLDGLPQINTIQYYGDNFGGIHVAQRHQPNDIRIKINRSLDNIEFTDSEIYRWGIHATSRNVTLSKCNEAGLVIISYVLYNTFISGFEQNVSYDDDLNFAGINVELVLTFDYFQLTV